MKINIQLLILFTLMITGCSNNPVLLDVKPTEDMTRLKTGNLTDFKIIKNDDIKYLTSTEIFNSISVSYRIGETLGFKNDFYIKTMLKNFTTKEGYNTELVLRSYDSKDKLSDELMLSRTDNDTVFSGKVYKNLTIQKMVNDVETNYTIDSKGKFQIIK
ncbi:hypothetical protein JCM19297_468 [Nonlabens ulvanivorans]|nr:hypothetical protein [Nonlabens ulvanivorans]GAK89846.1 hypothetical protein JCM19297_468 [Nonlabens ulvanivorans]